MKIKVGNLFDSTDKYLFITGNSYVTTKGDLVMGRGAALELATRLPILKSNFGYMIQTGCGHLGRYGLLVCPSYKVGDIGVSRWYGVFQVKRHFKSIAELDLIKYSTELLGRIQEPISINFPGIGYGGLKVEEVFPIIQSLNDNITVYVKDLHDLSR
jgi:hypothetical protein